MERSIQTTPLMSIVIPTRERGSYLEHAVRTCLANNNPAIEIVILDNASTDNTRDIIQRTIDPRVRYERSETRLSMRSNFERGLDLAKGEYLCFIGDDDGLLPHAVDTALNLFDRHAVDAVSAERAHYFWPDLLASRHDTALLPRRSGVEIRNSKTQLYNLLDDNHYYRLPCIYHGFVRRARIDKIKSRHGSFFLSSQVDIYSSVALSMENIPFAHSLSPLVINGGSARSNGASHFGGGSSIEKANWKQEDEIGFLPGFEDFATVGSLIVESAVRYLHANGGTMSDIFDPAAVARTMHAEADERGKRSLPVSGMDKAFEAAGVALPTQMRMTARAPRKPNRTGRMIKSFLQMRPLDMAKTSVTNVHGAAQHLAMLIEQRRTSVFTNPVSQLRAAYRIAFGNTPR